GREDRGGGQERDARSGGTVNRRTTGATVHAADPSYNDPSLSWGGRPGSRAGMSGERCPTGGGVRGPDATGGAGGVPGTRYASPCPRRLDAMARADPVKAVESTPHA